MRLLIVAFAAIAAFFVNYGAASTNLPQNASDLADLGSDAKTETAEPKSSSEKTPEEPKQAPKTGKYENLIGRVKRGVLPRHPNSVNGETARMRPVTHTSGNYKAKPQNMSSDELIKADRIKGGIKAVGITLKANQLGRPNTYPEYHKNQRRNGRYDHKSAKEVQKATVMRTTMPKSPFTDKLTYGGPVPNPTTPPDFTFHSETSRKQAEPREPEEPKSEEQANELDELKDFIRNTEH